MSGKLTSVYTLYFCTGKGQPVYFEDRRSRQVQSSEGAYVRTYWIPEGPSAVDTGWLKSPSLVVLRNEGKAPVKYSEFLLLPGEVTQLRSTGPITVVGPGEISVVAIP